MTTNSHSHRTTLRGKAPHELHGFTLVEIIVALGLFASVMTMASGAYLIMIRSTQEAQSISTGINNLSYALETMVRLIRTGKGYQCLNNASNCTTSDFTFTDMNGRTIRYNLAYTSAYTPNGLVVSKKYINKIVSGVNSYPLTDNSLLDITSMQFYVTGAQSESNGDVEHTQPNVRILIKGTIPVGASRPEKSFTIEASATMRGTDL